MSSLISLLIFCVIVFVLVLLGCWVVDRTMPGEVRTPAKVVIGAIGLIAILVRLLPMAGI